MFTTSDNPGKGKGKRKRGTSKPGIGGMRDGAGKKEQGGVRSRGDLRKSGLPMKKTQGQPRTNLEEKPTRKLLERKKGGKGRIERGSVQG